MKDAGFIGTARSTRTGQRQPEPSPTPVVAVAIAIATVVHTKDLRTTHHHWLQDHTTPALDHQLTQGSPFLLWAHPSLVPNPRTEPTTLFHGCSAVGYGRPMRPCQAFPW